MLKFDGLLGANPPALAAAGAFGHIVFKGPSVILISKIQCRRRAIFHTGQTPVAVFIYPEIWHFLIFFCLSHNFQSIAHGA
jgi:hypothetical protein